MLSVMEFVNALRAMPEAGELGDNEATEVFVVSRADLSVEHTCLLVAARPRACTLGRMLTPMETDW